jgi:hypothetical protein
MSSLFIKICIAGKRHGLYKKKERKKNKKKKKEKIYIYKIKIYSPWFLCASASMLKIPKRET